MARSANLELSIRCILLLRLSLS